MADEPNQSGKHNAARDETEARFRHLFDTMAQGVVYQDRDGNITSANPAAQRILGLTLDQMQGRTSTDPRWRAIHEDGSDFPGGDHPSMASLRTGRPVRDVIMGVFNPNDDRYHWLNVNAVPQFLPGETVPFQVYTAFEDITRQRQTEMDLAKSNAAQNVINDLLGLALEDLPLDEQLQRAIGAILSAPFIKIEPKGGIFLRDGDSLELTLKAGRGLPREIKELCGRVPFGKCLCGRAAQEGSFLFSNEVDHRHDLSYKGMVPHGHYAVPILSKATRGKTLGVIVLYVQPGLVSDLRDEEFLKAAANTLAGLIERKQAEEGLAEAKALSDSLNTVNAAIYSTLDFDEIMQKVVVEAGRAMGTGSTLCLLRSGQTWKIKYVVGRFDEIVGDELSDDEAAASVLAVDSGEPVVINDCARDSRVNSEVIKRYGIRSMLVVPLMTKAGAIGSLVFEHLSAPTPFTDAQVDFARKLSASVSPAIENAGLYARERGIAQTLQEALLAMPRRLDVVDLGYLYQSARTDEAAVGGDFYDAFDLGGGKTAFVIGDVSGKGLEAARTTALVKNAIKAYAYHDLTPAGVLREANEIALRSLEHTEFVTVFLAVLDEHDNRLTYCSAGHPPPLIKRKDGRVEELVVDGMAIGLIADADFADHQLTLLPGDCLIGYTDGVTEARRGGDFYGDQRLINFVEGLKVWTAQELPQMIFDEAVSFSGGALADDVALLVISPRCNRIRTKDRDMSNGREFQDWEKLYQKQAVETMPWYSSHLDPDFKQALIELSIDSGRLLDMGAGPGTQAIELAKMGYAVTATDISPTAVELAAAKAESLGLDIDWRQDDVLDTQLTGDFVCVFDRGLFHVLPIDQRDLYAQTIRDLLAPGGYLFLKCFSDKETSPGGPHRLSPADIETVFSSRFKVLSISESVFSREGESGRKALFCLLRKEN